MYKRKKKTEKRPSIREYVADSIGVSKEITLDVVKITSIGTRELTVENFLGVIEYTEKEVYLNAKPYPVKIKGESLEVKTLTKDIMYIYGTINRIDFYK